MRAVRLGVGRPIILEEVLVTFKKLILIGEGEHGEVAGSTVQEDGFNDASVQEKQ